jgi:hypothetical protein
MNKVRIGSTDTMEGTWLVQRLQKPFKVSPDHQLAKLVNAFSFGGGLRNGGLSAEAMELLRDVLRFDYMGSSEFEWGAVPEALERMAKSELEAFTVAVPLAEVPKPWGDDSEEEPEGSAVIFVLTPKKIAAEVAERIETFAREHIDLKESMHLHEALRPVREWHSDVCGWLELDNGFMFFTDGIMFQETCKLFGVEA